MLGARGHTEIGEGGYVGCLFVCEEVWAEVMVEGRGGTDIEVESPKVVSKPAGTCTLVWGDTYLRWASQSQTRMYLSSGKADR